MRANTALQSDEFLNLQSPKVVPDDVMVLAVGKAGRIGSTVASALRAPQGIVDIKRFSDGESRVSVLSSVREKDVYLLAGTSQPANESIMELCITLDAIKKASARRITVVMPYFGYGRQDRRTTGREPITAQLVARFIEEAGADRVVLFDVHSEQIAGFFRKPVDNIYGTKVLVPALEETLKERGISKEQIVVVSPDAGGVKRARAVAKELGGAPLAVIDKDRPRPNEVGEMILLGDVKGKVCITVDDMVDTGRTLIQASDLLKKKGCVQNIALVVHPVLSGDSQERIRNSSIDLFITTDSIPLRKRSGLEFQVVKTAPMFADVIEKMSSGESLSHYR